MSTYMTRGNTLRRSGREARLEQLQDGQHDVVDVAEARGLRLLRVVQTSRPVHTHLVQTLVQSRSGVYGE